MGRGAKGRDNIGTGASNVGRLIDYATLTVKPLLTAGNLGIIGLMLKAKDKAKIVSKHAVHEKDTGSPEVQIALFTEEIERLAKHLKKHAKDNSSRTGLLKMVAKRKRLSDYLQKESPERYAKVAKELGLKK